MNNLLLRLFFILEYAVRKCSSDGRWEGKEPGDYSNPRGFTNYTNCYTPEALEIWKKFYGDKSSEQRQVWLYLPKIWVIHIPI